MDHNGKSSIRKLTHSLIIYALGNTDAATNIKHQSECMSKNKNQDLYEYFWQYDPQTKQFYCYQVQIKTNKIFINLDLHIFEIS